MKRKQEVLKNSREHEAEVRVYREKIRNEWKGDKTFEDEGGAEVLH